MGMLDNIANDGDIMNQPGMKEKIEEYARRTGVSIEEAKSHFMDQQNQQS